MCLEVAALVEGVGGPEDGHLPVVEVGLVHQRDPEALHRLLLQRLELEHQRLLRAGHLLLGHRGGAAGPGPASASASASRSGRPSAGSLGSLGSSARSAPRRAAPAPGPSFPPSLGGPARPRGLRRRLRPRRRRERAGGRGARAGLPRRGPQLGGGGLWREARGEERSERSGEEWS